MYGFEAMTVQREVDARAQVCLCSSLEGHAAQQIGAQAVHHRSHTGPFSFARWEPRCYMGACNRRNPKRWHSFFSGRDHTVR